MSLAAGARLGPYEILDYVGRGGMGAVYKGYDPALKRYVALKVLPAEVLHDASFAERFRREAEIWARLDHPSIVPVYFAGIEEGLPFLAMKFVVGGALSDLLKQGLLPPERVTAILVDVASALDHAHSLGIVHRDVKPANVLLGEDGRAYLTDFGIARVVAGSRPGSHSGTIVGTPGYMSPEQARSEQPDPRADIYSLGCMAYEMYTGSPPFKGQTPVDVMLRHITETPPPPRSIAPDLPSHVENAILKAMAKEPAHRWPTATLFGQALRGSVDADATVSLPGRPLLTPTPPPGATPTDRRVALFLRGEDLHGLLLATLIGVTLGAGLFVVVQRHEGGLSRTLSAGPDAASLETLLTAAQRAMGEGSYPEALRIADLAVRLAPGHAPARLLRDRIRRAWDAEKSLGLWQDVRPSPSLSPSPPPSPSGPGG